MEAIKIGVIILAASVCGGFIIGSFFNWLGERNAKREIKKHDEEVARKMRRKYHQHSNHQRL